MPGDGHFANALPHWFALVNSQKSALYSLHMVNLVASCLFENVLVGDGYSADTMPRRPTLVEILKSLPYEYGIS